MMPVTVIHMSTLRISISDMMALHVRIQGDKKLARPEHLYQRLPMRAMALMATIPCGDFEVSIPHQSDLGWGYPILDSLETSSDDIMVDYARQSNGLYKAVQVFFQDRAYGATEFREVACQWVEMHEGQLRIVPDRYAYFVPTQKLWGVILRDNGFIPLDPSIVPSEIHSQLLGSRANHGHLIARVPVCCGDRPVSGYGLPVFQQVELTLDPHPATQSVWTHFVDYQSGRTDRARPPACIFPDFQEWLQCLTAESGFERWIFRPGMFFGDRMEWWGDGNWRRTDHEGLDFAEGLSPAGGIRSVPEGTPARVIADGETIAFLDDFLGKTIVVRHPAIIDQNGDIFHTLYSHIRPTTGQLGPVTKGELLGCVKKLTAAGAPAHLHLTGAWIPQSIPSGKISMDHIDPAFVPVVLINFNDLLPAQS
jgi:hypothetical protein